MIDWTHWHNERLLVSSLVLVGWIYALGIGPWRHFLAGRKVSFPKMRAGAFYGALLLAYLAVGSPLDQIGERFLLSAHMVQHQILMYVVAPLLILGLPPWLTDSLSKIPGVKGTLRLFLHPVFTAAVFTAVLTLWHLPEAYDLALRVKWVHIVQHQSFLLVSVLMWWPILSRSKTWPPLSYAGRILYAFFISLLKIPVSVYLTFSSEVLYPTYEFAPRITPLSPMEDQVLSGILMTVGGMGVALLVIGLCFYRWYEQSLQRGEA